MKSKYKILSVLTVIVLCVVVYFFHVVSNERIQKFYIKSTHESLYDLKKSFIKDTVNNQISRIEVHLNAEIKQAEQFNSKLEIQLTEKAKYFDSPEDYKDYFETPSVQGLVSAVLWNNESQEVLYDPDGLSDKNTLADLLDSREDYFAASSYLRGEVYSALYGVTKTSVYDRVKADITEEIHTSKFAENTYIWVNEIINYEGGPDYAIRRIHPNLPETEGQLLSTATTDIKGNLPYLEELNGVKANGEIYFTYYFKKNGSEAISEKLSYAKLYKPFDWIVAMGVHVDDTDLQVDKTTERGQQLANALSMYLYLLIASVFAVTVLFLFTLEHWVFKKSQKVLEDKINMDHLTGAFSRNAGEQTLAILHSEFKNGHESPAICMFDIDGFKRINDTYGHDVGDLILRRVVKRVMATVRSTDRIYRWGGDEFLLVCPGVDAEKAMNVFDKFRSEIAKTNDQDTIQHVQSTVSMGIAFFNETDTDAAAVLKRADIALYKAKEDGRNCVRMS